MLDYAEIAVLFLRRCSVCFRNETFSLCVLSLDERRRKCGHYFTLSDEWAAGLAAGISADISKVGPFHVGTTS